MTRVGPEQDISSWIVASSGFEQALTSGAQEVIKFHEAPDGPRHLPRDEVDQVEFAVEAA